MLKRLVKRCAVSCAGLLIMAALLVAGLLWYHLPMRPYFDDGPFTGTSISPAVDRSPDQALPIYNGFTLEVYDPLIEGESPIVQLRDSSNHVQWSIRADGFESGDVREIRFMEAHRGLARSGTVTGAVRWTYGHEITRWYITENGELRDYWYSW